MPRGGESGGRGGFGGGNRSHPTSSSGEQQRADSTNRQSRPSASAPSTPAAETSPSMMKQMATTAGGVAAGAILSHAAVASLSPRQRIPYYHEMYNRASSQPLRDDPCGQILKGMISCMQMGQGIGDDLTSICSRTFDKCYMECLAKNGLGDPKY